ncbi:MAG: hypothetical protein P1S60_01690 [Anaerolineae bacterium]|nr:hypothetical protein [Anaerolineae bacterium]
MKLTRRQEEFIDKLLDLYWEQRAPIHYSVLAERLGVSPFTAYDMLRLLEEKGQVTSEYQLDPEKSGPGRTVRVFMPSAQMLETARHLGVQNTDWVTFKQRIIDNIHRGEVRNPELAEEFLALVPPEGPQALQYCIEVMTVTALRLRRGRERQQLLVYMRELLTKSDAASRANLCLLGGLAFGALAEENSDDPGWVTELFDHVRKYQVLVEDMEDDQRQLLIDNIHGVFNPPADEL